MVDASRPTSPWRAADDDLELAIVIGGGNILAGATGRRRASGPRHLGTPMGMLRDASSTRSLPRTALEKHGRPDKGAEAR